MPANPELLKQIETALAAFGTASLVDASLGLFDALGYRSERRMKLRSNTPDGFLGTFDRGGTLNKDRTLLADWQGVEFLFQLTDAEVQSSTHGTAELPFDSKGKFDGAEINSFLFLALELRPAADRDGERKGQHYNRTELAGVTRALNRLFDMPALLVLKHGDTVSLGIIHRRLSKRDAAKDVLEKVTLIKDIAFADPIRAHVEILHDFALPQLVADYAVANFVALHAAWQKRLGSYALSEGFYREIADWYFWAHHQVEDGAIRLPQHCDTEQEKSLFLIRLLTRVIFSWFLVEKRLIPTDLFRDHRLTALLKDFNPSRDPAKPDSAPTYYHAVLQNLFFGTLNMPADQRGFREKKKEGERYDPNFGVTNLWRYETDFRTPADWLRLAASVPFLNGGLFDCLDDKIGKREDNTILDGFSDNPKLACHLPNDLFFGPERTVDLSRDYGEEDKRTARSKKARVRGLIEILSRYKFTIEENTPLEEEIALDPELLGKVFENLLASYNEDTRTTARKALGAFYTPREIVSYMVDEALKSYLATQVPRCKGALDDLFSNKATLRDIKPDTRDALIAAIGKVKILDPACGSGAFPMGALHRLVDLLQKLDPNNESWKRDRLAEARRYRALLESSHTGKEELDACDARIADIEKSFDTRYHALDFARKLYLIENSIYGVDIQPIATQIAKLRFFISLVVDQKVEPTAPNLGVRPLPNLETRLVAADTLIPIEKAESDLFSGEIDRLRAELAGIRHEHFNARSPAAKRKWRDADAAKRQEIAALLEREHAIARDSAKKLAAWDPYDQNAFAPFFDSEWMFGRTISESAQPAGARKGGGWFDVVIGNPPYGAFLTEEQKDQLKHIFDHIAQRIRNTYLYFLGAGYNLVKDGGIVTYIIPNEFLFQIYMTKARGYFLSNARYLFVVNVGEDAFEAIVPTAIVAIQKTTVPEYDIPVADLRECKLEEFPQRLNTRQFIRISSRLVAATPNQIFSFDSKKTGIVNRLSSGFRKFEDFCHDVANGVCTSCDAVYIVDDKLVEEGEFERHFVKPTIRGGQFQRFWVPSHTGDNLLYVTDTFNETNGKRVLKYLAKHRDLLVRKSVEKKAGNRDWHVLFRARYEELFSVPKIMIRQTGDHIVAAADREVGYFCINSVNIAAIKPAHHAAIPFLVGVLNSAVVHFFYREISQEAGRALAEVKPQRVRVLPIPESTSIQRLHLSNLVECISTTVGSREAHPETQTTRDPLMLAYWEQILNGLVYELYFPEELHAAGLRIFDLVAKADLPDITKIPEKERLSTLRKKFEEVYDIEYSLRAALFSLGNLETVRIIEGKE
jgi:adenine-specific DNA-methyltransferase